MTNIDHHFINATLLAAVVAVFPAISLYSQDLFPEESRP